MKTSRLIASVLSLAFLGGMAYAADVPLRAEKLEALPKTKKIIVSNFIVEFQNRYEKTSRGFSLLGLGNAGSSTVTNDVTLPPQETLQLITNFAYLEVVKKLRAKGYEVIEVSQLSEKGQAIYQKLLQDAPLKSGEVLDNVDGDSVVVSPDGLISLYPNSGCGHYSPESKLSKFGARMTYMGRAASSAVQTQHENDLARAEGNVPLLKVWITVGFGEAEAKGGNAFISARQERYASTTTTISNSANANATAGMFLKPEVTRFAISVPEDTSSKYNHTCAMQLTKWSKTSPPTDGDVLLYLDAKLHDDGSPIVSLENQAGTVSITDRAIGGGIGIRSVKENADGSNPRSGGSGDVQLSLKNSSSAGTVSTSGMGTSIHTASEYATNIRADYYASTTIKLIDDVTNAFIGRMATAQ